ncbi:CZB domain-containing protein [Rhodovulum sp. DZ06]|uniref:CZB domain-containing protein n=1 Tax=Rhodovulum sp. DZ06 TaxID=3425126 RepID=UPI003D32F695
MDLSVLDMQIREALDAHEGWKAKLSVAVTSGKLPKPARDIACDDQCAFGKWLHSMKRDPVVSGMSGFRNTMEAHAGFHEAAGAVAAKVERGDKAGAGAELSGAAFRQATNVLKSEMLLWRQQAARQA